MESGVEKDAGMLLIEAIWERHKEDATALIQTGSFQPYLHTVDHSKRSPLHIAVLTLQLDILDLLLKSHIELLSKADAAGSTALHYAVTVREAQIAERLVSAGASAAQQNKRGESAFHLAVVTRQLAVAEMLYNDDIDVNTRDRDGYAPLHYAARFGRLELLQLLLDRLGADVNVRCFDGGTPLHESCSHRRLDANMSRAAVVAFLLHHGAKVSILDYAGEAAVQRPFAATSTGDEVRRLLNDATERHGAFIKSATSSMGREQRKKKSKHF